MNIYKAISRNWCTGKSVIDVGSGIGIGTNILGWDAMGVWGIDNNPENIKVAKQLYETPRIKFDDFDITNPPTRPVATFDVVVCIEVMEHIKDYETALLNLKRFHDPKRRTVFFISSPNRNNRRLSKEKPENEFHVREWTAREFYDVLTKHFGSVVMYAAALINNFTQDETVDGNTPHSPILAKCEFPK
jgi:2-polyprenyl-3-methyl-5-hydroxy-6-metoxy-1,4-benzoquinol methylase